MKRVGKCPACGNVLVFDCGLYHCDAPDGSEGCGAWDEESIWDWELTPVDKRATLST